MSIDKRLSKLEETTQAQDPKPPAITTIEVYGVYDQAEKLIERWQWNNDTGKMEREQ